MKTKCKIYTQNEMLTKVNMLVYIKIIHKFAGVYTY